MPSKSPRVAAYISDQLKERFTAFRKERGIRSESQALTTILVEFLGVSSQGSQKVDYSSFVTQDQFNELASKITEILDAGSGKSPSDLLSKLPEKLKRIEVRLDLLEQSRADEFTLGTGELAKRLSMPSSTLSHWKSDDPKRGKSPDELLKATRAKDPDEIGWILIPESGRFKPEKPIPRNLLVGSPAQMQGDLLDEALISKDDTGELLNEP